ncbi:hypothetical protein MKA31_14675 [[Clostridium] innocuum]|uniref:PTS sugar transporter subunit IIA n=1 Tax=Clostridium innocuum TaxID=1522 RepID=UPI0021485E5D|nr:hypothetical protein [[Clostridium] innocuum]MCR0273330.1 hypothetical protein [[Clostridium] innocuum]
MEKILLLTHGGWGASLKKSIEMIIGPVDFVEEIALYPKDLLNEFQERIQSFITQQHRAAQLREEPLHLLIMTDLFGGTPTNAAAVIANTSTENIHVVTGLNSALLLEACTQILNQGTVDIAVLIENSQNSIFNVMEKIYRKGD